MKTALLFDLDGTLIESDSLHAKVFADMFAERGRTIDFDFYRENLHGRLNRDIFSDLCPGEDPDALGDAKEAEYRRRLADGIPPMEGTVKLLDLADQMGWPKAVVTNAPRDNSEAVLDKLGIAARFDTVVIGDECAHAKPNPEPYLEGLRRLGADAAVSLAFEDSPAGIRAAVSAGLLTIGLRSMLSDQDLRAAGATTSIADYDDPALIPYIEKLQGIPA